MVRNHIYSTSQMQGVAYTHSTCTCMHLCEKHVDLQHYTCLCAETNLFCLQVLNSFAHRDKHQQDLHILHTSCETCTPLECLWKVYNVKVESIPFIIKKLWSISIFPIINCNHNPQRMCSRGYCTWSVCVCVSV